MDTQREPLRQSGNNFLGTDGVLEEDEGDYEDEEPECEHGVDEIYAELDEMDLGEQDIVDTMAQLEQGGRRKM